MSFSEAFDVPAAPRAVFDALLDEKILTRWLAENVRVEPRKGGGFCFWGRDVIWCNSEDEAEGEILELERPHTLVFSWRWKGHQSRVSFRVSEDGPNSQLAVEHSFETFDSGAGPGPDMAGCHWRIAVGNLASVLRSGRGAIRADYCSDQTYSADQDDTECVQVEIEIAAPPARVFEALLDPAQVQIWMQAGSAEIDTDSMRYSYGWTRDNPPVEIGPTRILELIPDRLLVHDWQWPDEVDGQVRWELSPSETGTRLRLIHTHTSDHTNRLGWSDALVSISRLVDAT